ncbi:MAG: hypothetical protein LBP60_03090 [Spirochaetaceae bacterium]|jgi:hypothetical protein|nr:hypothetical protein [Spirochaetaceae bacterium]
MSRLYIVFLAVVLGSCIGVGSEIRIDRNGSGSLKLHYRIASGLEDLGSLDGNERWLPVPVGRADMERTVARIQGLTLVSYSSRQEGLDTLHSAELSFASPGALEAFFDSSGRLFTADLPDKRLRLAFPQTAEQDRDFKELLSRALEAYTFSISLSLPGTVRVAWLDGEGKPATVFPGDCSVAGSTLSYSVPMADLVFLDMALQMEISW